MDPISILPVGDAAVKIQYHASVSPALNRKIHLFCLKLAKQPLHGMVEWVPAFDSITVYYQPNILSFARLKEKLTQMLGNEPEVDNRTSRTIYVPVVYGGGFGPDLHRVAKQNQLTEQNVISIHQQSNYLVYMLGFLPGFPYLGGMENRIATPRLDQPREHIEAGSVGIAHAQTGVYPMASPGGWNIIGKTPLQLFDSSKSDDAFLFRTGDMVQFYQVSTQVCAEIKEMQENGTFHVEEKYHAQE